MQLSIRKENHTNSQQIHCWGVCVCVCATSSSISNEEGQTQKPEIFIKQLCVNIQRAALTAQILKINLKRSLRLISKTGSK